jgi:hypothetical protein
MTKKIVLIKPLSDWFTTLIYQHSRHLVQRHVINGHARFQKHNTSRVASVGGKERILMLM